MVSILVWWCIDAPLRECVFFDPLEPSKKVKEHDGTRETTPCPPCEGGWSPKADRGDKFP